SSNPTTVWMHFLRPPFFALPIGRQRRRLSEFGQTAADGACGAAQEGGKVADAAVAQFEGFEGGVVAAGAFGQRSVEALHRTFDVLVVGECHAADPRRERFLFPTGKNRGTAKSMPDRPNRTVIKFSFHTEGFRSLR